MSQNDPARVPNYRDDHDEVTFLALCRELRQFSSDAERLLWQRLRNRQVGGAKFRRQHQFGPYILDFYCHEHRLVIEADGDQHAQPDVAAYDAERTGYLEERGLRVVRFSNREILVQTAEVVNRIWEAVTPQ